MLVLLLHTQVQTDGVKMPLSRSFSSFRQAEGQGHGGKSCLTHVSGEDALQLTPDDNQNNA